MIKEQKKIEDEMEIDLDDPDVGRAAVKIQSSFRGHKARKDVLQMKNQSTIQAKNRDVEFSDSESNSEDSENDDESSESEDDEEVQTDKTPFALLKSLYGIMNISKFGIKTNKVGIIEEKAKKSADAESKSDSTGQSSSGKGKK